MVMRWADRVAQGGGRFLARTGHWPGKGRTIDRCAILRAVATHSIERDIRKTHETAADITTVVQAQVRLCAAGVPRAPDRAGRAAHRRSRSGRGASRANLRYLPAHRSSREEGATGDHCRYRRQEPGLEARPVAVAADADRGYGRYADQAWRGRDRLRHRI